MIIKRICPICSKKSFLKNIFNNNLECKKCGYVLDKNELKLEFKTFKEEE